MLKEITIQFVEQCNLSCPYCFAVVNKQGYLSEDSFNSFLNFCQTSNLDIVHVTGGEPTMHPLFGNYISELSNLAALVIYTNFTVENVIENMAVKNPNDVVFLVNITSKFYSSERQAQNLEQNIKKALQKGFRVALSYTFHKSKESFADEFDFLINKMHEYNLRNLRISQALSFNNNRCFLQVNDIERLYHYVAENIPTWKQQGYAVYFDCPVPPCYIQPVDFSLLREYNAVSLKCIPKVFVTVDLAVTHCYSTFDKRDHYLKEFSSYQEAKAYSNKILTDICAKAKRNGCYKCIYGDDGIPCGCPTYCV